jgi:hypothetical protein
MKNKEEIVYKTESEEYEELAENTGAFISWLSDYLYELQLKYDNKTELFNLVCEIEEAINNKLEEEA